MIRRRPKGLTAGAAIGAAAVLVLIGLRLTGRIETTSDRIERLEKQRLAVAREQTLKLRSARGLATWEGYVGLQPLRVLAKELASKAGDDFGEPQRDALVERVLRMTPPEKTTFRYGEKDGGPRIEITLDVRTADLWHLEVVAPRELLADLGMTRPATKD